MDYMALKEFLSEFNIEEIDLSSSELLKIVLENKKEDLYNCFKLSAWSIDNLKLFLNNIQKEVELNILLTYDLRYLDSSIKSEFIKELVKRKYYRFLINHLSFISIIEKNEEYLKILLSDIESIKLVLSELRLICDANKNMVVDKVINSNRIDFICYLLHINVLNSIDLTPLIGKAKTIYDFSKRFNLDIPRSIFKNNKELFKDFVMNCDPTYMEACIYLGFDMIFDYINSDEELLSSIIENAKTDKMDKIIPYSHRFPKLLANPEYLNIILKRKQFTNIALHKFKEEAWNVENQILYYKYKSEGYTIVGNYDSPVDVYFVRYSNSTPYIDKNLTYTEIDTEMNFKSFKQSYIIGKDVVEGIIDDNSILTKYYKFIYEVSSNNVHTLIMILTNNNKDNLDKLFDNNGITPFFKEFLLYDYDYIKYRGPQIIEEINTKEYATYVKYLLLDAKSKEYLNGVYITQYSINKYINGETFTKEFVTKALNHIGINAIEVLLKNDFKLELSDLESKFLAKYMKIESKNIKNVFFTYYIQNKDNIDEQQIDSVYDLIVKITNSNSYEIRSQSDNIIANLIKLENYQEVYADLEYVFTCGSTPEFMKRFVMYKIIYGDRDLKKDYGVTSPILKSVSREEADKIIIRDLLNISLSNNSKDIENYFKILFNGSNLYTKLRNMEVEGKHLNQIEYTTDELELLHEFRNKLEFIFKYLTNMDYISSNNDYETIKSMEKAYLASQNMVYNFDFHLPTWESMVFEQVFGETPYLLLTYSGKHQVLKTALEESKKIKGVTFSAKAGDFIKGVESKHLNNIFEYGSLSKEFLGENSQEDMTHLDTDMSLITKDVNTIPELLSLGVTGCTFADMNLVISQDYMNLFNEMIDTTDLSSDREFTEEEKSKTEIFRQPKSEDHYCIRTGFPLTYVSAIIASKNFSRAKLIALKNSFFIPIYDKQGNLIFSFKDYYDGQKLLDGLSYYDKNTYTISENLSNEEVQSILSEIDDNTNSINNKRNIIFSKLNEVFSKYFKSTKYKLGSSVEKGIAEIIDTGSTGRRTNIDKEGDFDFILRLDREFLLSDKLSEFSSEIYRLFGKTPGDSKVIRMENVKIDGIDELLKLDITIIDKNSKIDYSTDMCINDRLNTIKKLYPDKYNLVIANIIQAKKFFKNIGIYKKNNGGFGGVGVENFVLQHGGSFYDAITSFVECAKSCKNLSEFKEKYSIYDFGKNHYTYSENSKLDFPYDNYVNFLTDDSFSEMIKAFEEYINQTKDIKMV